MRHILPLFVFWIVLAGPVSAQEGATTASAANNAFAWGLYRALAKGNDNLFFSPYSISSALAMTRVGAAGQTARQMDTVLHTAGVKASDHRALLTSVLPVFIEKRELGKTRLVRAYELSIANALWGQETVQFEKPFLDTLEGKFGAPLSRVDFREPKKVRDLINAWVKQHTKKKIQNIVPPGMPTRDTRLVLGNAIYFKAQWAESFEKPATKPATFTMLDGKKIQVPMMHRIDRHRYAATDDLQIVEVPYRGDHTSMFVVLPKKPAGLPAIEAKLDAKKIESLRGRMKSTRVQLKMPRFKFTSAFNLADNLPAMGMKDAFDPAAADFTGMTRQVPLFIGAVLHKAFIAVDENGTEAAAATLVMMDLGSVARTKPVPFVADHPFLFFIRHKGTGCILFAGRVTTPETRLGNAKSARPRR